MKERALALEPRTARALLFQTQRFLCEGGPERSGIVVIATPVGSPCQRCQSRLRG